MEKNAKIYVAGHAGLVGSSIIRTLIANGYRNIVTRSFTELDLRRQQETEDFFAQEKPDYVFLAAAKVGGILANNTYKAEFIYDNLAIATNVIHAAYLHGVKKLLNLGSSCIYPKLAPQPLKEEFLLSGHLEPTNEPYAIAKIAAIKLCQYYNEQYNTNFISVMPTNMYGPSDNFDLETAHVLPTLIRKFHLATLLEQQNFEAIAKDFLSYPIGKTFIKTRNNKDIEKTLATHGIFKNKVILWGTGSAFREFLYVDDLSRAIIFLMQQKEFVYLDTILLTQNHSVRTTDNKNYENKKQCPFINIGTGKDISIKELAGLIKTITNFHGEIIFDSSKPDGTPKKLLDVSKIQSLGWKHTINLKKGICMAYQAYLSQQNFGNKNFSKQQALSF